MLKSMARIALCVNIEIDTSCCGGPEIAGPEQHKRWEILTWQPPRRAGPVDIFVDGVENGKGESP